MKTLIPALCAALLLSAPLHASEVECGPLVNMGNIGPWDYASPSSRVPTGEDPMGRIKRVENVHFNPEMKALNTKKYSIDRLTGEIGYTLRVFPNHTYALNAISRLEKMNGGKLPQGSANPITPRITADCYFDRAIRFRPNDPAVHLVHGIHLHDRKRYNEALAAYKKAEALGDSSPNLHYNLGLLYTDMKDWQNAQHYARLAYSTGIPLPGLRQRLAKAGYKLN